MIALRGGLPFRIIGTKRMIRQVQLLQEKLVRADTKIAEKELQIQQLNVALKQAEDAGKKERIRIDTQRGNLVKRTKYQWFLDNNISETLSEQEAQNTYV